MEDRPPQKRNRLPNHWAGAYIAVAFAFDGVEALLNFALGIGVLLNRLITIIYNFGLFFFFAFRRIPFWHTRRLTNSGIGFLVEITPLLDTLPAKTVTAIINIRIVRREDHEYNKKNEEAWLKNMAANNQVSGAQARGRRAQMLQKREGRKMEQPIRLEEWRRKKQLDEENAAALREKQVAADDALYHAAGTRDLRNVNYQPLRRAA